LDCSCLNLTLGIFLQFLEFFRVFFVALSIYLDNSGFIFAQEKYVEKNISYLPGPSPWARPAPARPARVGPSLARRGPSGHRPEADRGLAMVAALAPRAPIKGAPPARRPSCVLDPPPPYSQQCRRRPAALPRLEPNRACAAGVDRGYRPLPFVSHAGEHTIAIPSISSLRFASYSSPYSPGTLRI
jgi:hypothetical protein